MTYIRKLPSGKFQATVRGPGGKRYTRTDKLKSVVKAWGDDKEAELRHGEWRDPKAGRVTLGEWHDKWWAARVVAETTAARDRKNLDRYVLPYWKDQPLDSITRMGVEGWVRRLGRDGGRKGGKPAPLGAPTVRLAYFALSSMLDAAAKEHPPIILANPCHGVRLPTLPTRKRRFFTDAECAAILEKLSEPYRTAAELSMWSGLRFEEFAGLHGSDVDWLAGTVEVRWVMTPLGLREHPKTADSARIVPVRAETIEAMSALMRGRERGELLFINRGKGPLNYKTWHWHWTGALKAAGVAHASPHTCRHTSASRLVQAGRSLYEVQAFLGHESVATTARYSHLAPDAHEGIRDVWISQSRRTSDARAVNDQE